jgi:uncharacterized membrane protein
MKHKEFLGSLDQQRIEQSIANAEDVTSGEIRVHVQPRVVGAELRTVAEKTFERLGMTKTALHNGVLLFIASEDRKFVILGDKGINDKVPAGFWDDVLAKLTIRFKAGEFTDGIVEAVGAVGEHLSRHFPPIEGDVNELSNKIDVTDD